MVNDGSTDLSLTRICSWMGGKKNVYLINLENNRGMAAALEAGFYFVKELLESGKVSEDDIVINIDADGQHRSSYINDVVTLMDSQGYEVLLTRRDFSCYPWSKRYGNRVLSFVGSLLSGFKYNDIESGFRFLKVKTIPEFLKYYTGYKYSCAQELGIITALLKYKVSNDYLVEIEYYRPGAKITDAIFVITFGVWAFVRVKFGLAKYKKIDFSGALQEKRSIEKSL